MQKYPTCTLVRKHVQFSKKGNIYFSINIHFLCLMICHYQTHRDTVTQTKANPLIQVTSLTAPHPGMWDCIENKTLLDPCVANRCNFRKCTDLWHLNIQFSLDFIIVHWCFTLYIWLTISFLFDCNSVGSTRFNINQDNRNVPIASELEFKFIVAPISPLEACDSEVNVR